jgi:endonuclease/exonuclease/phosphatase family metal-dependent hydrolase
MKLRIIGLYACFLAAGICPASEEGGGAAGSMGVESGRLRVLSYNIHHAAGMDGKVDMERIARVIRSANPDIVALQEVDRGVSRSGKVDQLAKLEELTGMSGLFSKSISFGGGAYGNAVLTRLPVMKHETLALPGGEARSVLIATLRTRKADPASEFVFFATHFAFSQEKNRVKAAAKISAYLKTHKIGAALLAGDLNARPASETMRAVFRDWTDSSAKAEHPTVPVGEPKGQIDYVLYRPAAGWKVVSVKVLDEAVASDHRPILVTLERITKNQ